MTNSYAVNVHIACRNIELTDGIKAHAEKKFSHTLSKFAHQDLEVHLVLHIEKNRQVAEAQMNVSGHTFHAKEEGGDMYVAIDNVADILAVQLKKNKEKQVSHH